MGVTKIFRIELKGGKTAEKDIVALKDQMRLLGIEAAKVREAISGVTGNQSDSKKVADLKLQLADLEKQMVSLNQQRNDLINTSQKEAAVSDVVSKGAKTQAGEFFKLNQAYKEAKINAQEMAAKFGVESDQAIKAAASASLLKDQLLQINNLVKTGGISGTAPANIPITSTNNVAAEKAEAAADLELAESKEVLTEKERKQDEVRDRLDAKDKARAAERDARRSKEASDIEKIIPPLTNVSTKYEQYTGTLRENQAVQAQNEITLTKNAAEQKIIQKELATTGSLTAEQTARFATLREEEILLTESNKALTITIRNQAKEILAEEGSIDELQAQLNQLQQTYQQLTAEERSTPFGQGMKAELDILEPKVKALEYELGIFGRNVGNYPQAYTKAFKVLETELDVVKGKLVKGNFTGKDFDDLAAKEKVLKSATDSLGASYATTTARQTALKESARQLGLVYGTDSKVFKDFAVQVAAGNTELKKTDTALAAATTRGNGFTKGLSSIFAQLRNIAYVIPGIGIAGLIGLILTPLGALGSKLFDFATAAKTATNETERLKQQYKGMREAIHESSDAFVDASQKVETLKIEIDLARKGFLNKTDVVNEYNKTLGDTLGKVTSLDEAEKKLTENGEKYIRITLLKAAANIALEKAAQKAFEAEETRQKKLEEFTNAIADSRVVGSTLPGTGSFNAREFDAETKRINDARKKRQADAIKIAEDGQKKQKDIAAALLEEAAKLSPSIFFPDDKEKQGRTKLSNALLDALRLIEEARLRAVAIENNYVNEIQKIRELTFDEEITHIKKIEAINVDAFNKKIALFQRQKKLNAEEKRQLAEFIEQKSALELKTNQDVQAVEKKRFDRQAKDLKNALDEQIAIIKEHNAEIQNDPTISNVAKAQAQIDADNKILAAEQTYYESLLKLNANFNKDVLSQTREALTNLQKIIKANRKLLFEGTIKDIADVSGKLSDEFKTILAQGTINVVTSDLSPRKQAAALLKLEQDAADLLLANQVAALKREVEANKKALDEKLINEKQYLDKLAEYKAAEAKLIERNVDRELSLVQRIRNAFKDFGISLKELVFGIRSYTNDAAGAAQKTKDAFAEGLGGIKQAIQTSYQLYFKSQNDAIEKQKEVQLAFLDRQKANVLATAQSEAEKATIERQFEIKRQKVEKEAAERKKKLALKEATINFAVAAIKTFATYGWPLGLIAVAGLTAAYLAERAAINQQQFAEGGKVQPQRIKNGLIKHTGNIRPLYNGDNVLATVRTGEVILNRRQQAALGGHKTFKAIGVPGFATGGGVPGASLTAPTFTAASFNSRNIQDDSRLIRLEAMTERLIGSVYATDQKEVVLNPKKVTDSQKRTKRDVNLATI